MNLRYYCKFIIPFGNKLFPMLTAEWLHLYFSREYHNSRQNWFKSFLGLHKWKIVCSVWSLEPFSFIRNRTVCDSVLLPCSNEETYANKIILLYFVWPFSVLSKVHYHISHILTERVFNFIFTFHFERPNTKSLTGG
jgi:hypothetical protein